MPEIIEAMQLFCSLDIKMQYYATFVYVTDETQSLKKAEEGVGHMNQV